jgi:hypothetical protein
MAKKQPEMLLFQATIFLRVQSLSVRHADDQISRKHPRPFRTGSGLRDERNRGAMCSNVSGLRNSMGLQEAPRKALTVFAVHGLK